MSVPWITEYAVQCIPAWTCESAMIGSPAARAGAAGTRRAATAAASGRTRMKAPA